MLQCTHVTTCCCVYVAMRSQLFSTEQAQRKGQWKGIKTLVVASLSSSGSMHYTWIPTATAHECTCSTPLGNSLDRLGPCMLQNLQAWPIHALRRAGSSLARTLQQHHAFSSESQQLFCTQKPQDFKRQNGTGMHVQYVNTGSTGRAVGTYLRYLST
eukprot:528313-Pelagomonas_calceolata.AAC.5